MSEREHDPGRAEGGGAARIMDRREREGRRDSFLADAEDYFAVRPGYPDGLLEEAVELAGLSPPDRILEMGCGTGEATEWFAHRGFRLLAMDRSPDMIRMARRRLAGVEGVELRVRDFEKESPEDRFVGVLMATSYHWFEPTTRVERCADALEPGGALILLWHTHPLPFTGYHARSQPIYEHIVPGWTPPASPGMSEERISTLIEELTADGVFGRIERRTHDWRRVYDRDLYLRLLSTYSDHRLLSEEQRTRLFRELAQLIDRDFDGEVERPYRTELIVAHEARRG